MFRKRRHCLLLPAGLTVRRLMATVFWTLEGPHTKILMDGFKWKHVKPKPQVTRRNSLPCFFFETFSRWRTFPTASSQMLPAWR